MAENRGRMKSAQKDRMVTLIADAVMNRPIADMTAKEQQSMWLKITQDLNELGPYKTKEQWKRCWTDVKSTVKEKISKGKGKKITKIDMKVVAIMNKERQSGSIDLHDIGIHSETPTSPRGSVASNRSRACTSNFQSNIGDRRSMERTNAGQGDYHQRVSLSLMNAYGLNQASNVGDSSNFENCDVYQTKVTTATNCGKMYDSKRTTTVTSASLASRIDNNCSVEEGISSFRNASQNSDDWSVDRTSVTASNRRQAISTPMKAYCFNQKQMESTSATDERTSTLQETLPSTFTFSEYGNNEISTEHFYGDMAEDIIGNAVHKSPNCLNQPDTSEYNGLRSLRNHYMSSSNSAVDLDSEYENIISTDNNSDVEERARERMNGGIVHESGLSGHLSNMQRQRSVALGQVAVVRGGVRGHGSRVEGAAFNESPTVIDREEDVAVSEIRVNDSVRGRRNARSARRVPSNDSLPIYNSDRDNSIEEECRRSRGRGRGRGLARKQYQQRRPSEPLSVLADSSIKLQEEGTDILREIKRQNDVIIKQNEELIATQRNVALCNRDILKILRDNV